MPVPTFIPGQVLTAAELNAAFAAVSGGGASLDTGLVLAWSGVTTSIPTGYLVCDGTAVSRSTYSALYAVVGDRYGAGDGSTTFNLPKLDAGYVPLGTATLNASPGTGTRQTQAIATGNQSVSHNHVITSTGNSANQSADHYHNITSNSGNQSAAHNHGITSNAGNVNSDHSHNFSGNTGNISADHSHQYFKPNSGGYSNTGGVNSNHTHAYSGTTSGINANHQHVITSNAGNESANHTHAITSNASYNTANHNHVITVSATAGNESANHTHSVTGSYVVWIIKT